MLEIFERGGIMMYPLALASLILVAIVIERFIVLRKKRIISTEITSIVNQFSSFQDIELAKNICQNNKGPLSNLIQLSLDNKELDRAEIKEIVEDQGRQEVRKLEKGFGIMETIASIAPLMGLLGTVLGMIRVFAVIKEQGIGQASALSGGISEALISTVTGLFIAIPALVFFNYFSYRAENFVLDIEKYSDKLIQKIQHIKDQNSNSIKKSDSQKEK